MSSRRDVNETASTEVFSLRNTRKAYECEELGETQAFLDDLFYLMGGLSSKHKLNDRCLCALKLAEQCMSSEFRMSLRSSSDYLNKIFHLLDDAAKYKVIIYQLLFINYLIFKYRSRFNEQACTPTPNTPKLMGVFVHFKLFSIGSFK